MERIRAERILGLSPGWGEADAREAYRALSAHVEHRRQDAIDAADEEAQRARGEELRELDRALAILSVGEGPRGVAGATEFLAKLGSLTPNRWLLAWAITSTLIALVLALVLLLRHSEGSPGVLVGGSGGVGLAEGELVPTATEAAAQPIVPAMPGGDGGGVVSHRAELVAEANLAGATLEISSAVTGEVQAEGPADSRSYWLNAGDYVVRVRHSDCPDAWKEGVRALPRQQLKLEPRVCVETGWLVVHSPEADADLVIDGAPGDAGIGERNQLQAGEHRLEVRKRSFAPWQGIVEIEAGKMLEVTAELEEAEEESEEDLEADREGTRTWHYEVTQWLLSRYDRDRSGLLDTPTEIEMIPCKDWQRLDAEFQRGRLALPLTRFYGFSDDGAGWRENALGISYGMRHRAYLLMRECGLE